MDLPLHSSSKVIYFFSILFHNSFGNAEDVYTLLQKNFPELKLDNNLFYPEHNPLLSYYAKQMGADVKQLIRFFCNSLNPLERDYLSVFKTRALSLERSNHQPFRLLNIDPGFVAQEQMVLSSHKPFTHRIYLKDGIYAELEYLFRHQHWIELPWTYPDYKEDEKKLYFMGVRRLSL